MTLRAQLLVVAVAVVALAGIFWLVRRGSLKERFALIWLAIGSGLVILALVRPLVDRTAEWLGIEAGTTLVFVAAGLFLLGLVLHLSILVSSLEEKTRDLAEAVALLRADVEAPSEAGTPIEPPHQWQDQPQVAGEQRVHEPDAVREPDRGDPHRGEG